MNNTWLLVTILISLLWVNTVYFTALYLEINNIESNIPSCAEDEVIYYDNYPDGNLICIHMDAIR